MLPATIFQSEIPQEAQWLPPDIISLFLSKSTFQDAINISLVCKDWHLGISQAVQKIFNDYQIHFSPPLTNCQKITTFVKMATQKQAIALDISNSMGNENEANSSLSQAFITIEKIINKHEKQIRFTGLDCYIFGAETLGMHIENGKPLTFIDFKLNNPAFKTESLATIQKKVESEKFINKKIIAFFKQSRPHLQNLRIDTCFRSLFENIRKRNEQFCQDSLNSYNVYILTDYDNDFPSFANFQKNRIENKITFVKLQEETLLDVFQKDYLEWKEEKISSSKSFSDNEEALFSDTEIQNLLPFVDLHGYSSDEDQNSLENQQSSLNSSYDSEDTEVVEYKEELVLPKNKKRKLPLDIVTSDTLESCIKKPRLK